MEKPSTPGGKINHYNLSMRSSPHGLWCARQDSNLHLPSLPFTPRAQEKPHHVAGGEN